MEFSRRVQFPDHAVSVLTLPWCTLEKQESTFSPQLLVNTKVDWDFSLGLTNNLGEENVFIQTLFIFFNIDLIVNYPASLITGVTFTISSKIST